MKLTPRLRAFTLIELLIVITIIGILSVALVPRIASGPAKARDAQRKADLQQIATALELMADDDGGSYPASNGACVNAVTASDESTNISDYLTTVPNDPSSAGWGSCSDGYAYVGLDTSGDGNYDDGYFLIASLESENDKGGGVYDTSFGITDTESASENFTTNNDAGLLCSDGGCGDNVIYVLGR